MESKEKKAIWGTIGFIVISVAIFWFLKRFLDLDDGIAYTSILILPIVVYLVLADKVKSFKVGDIEATFKEVANEKVKTGKDSIEQLPNNPNLDVIEKGSVDQLRQVLSDLKGKSDHNKIILTLELGKGDYYKQWAVKSYVKALSVFRNFKFISIVDSDKKVIAFIHKEKLISILENHNLGQEFIRVINEGDIDGLKIFPGLITNKVTDETKNIDALKEMDKYNTDELIVTGNDGKLKGVIEREDILSKLMIALAK